MRISKPTDNVTSVDMFFRHNAAKVIYELMKKHRLIIVTERYNNRHLVTLKDSYVVKKFTPNTVHSYCALSGREVVIDVDDIKRIEILD